MWHLPLLYIQYRNAIQFTTNDAHVCCVILLTVRRVYVEEQAILALVAHVRRDALEKVLPDRRQPLVGVGHQQVGRPLRAHRLQVLGAQRPAVAPVERPVRRFRAPRGRLAGRHEPFLGRGIRHAQVHLHPVQPLLAVAHRGHQSLERTLPVQPHRVRVPEHFGPRADRGHHRGRRGRHQHQGQRCRSADATAAHDGRRIEPDGCGNVAALPLRRTLIVRRAMPRSSC